jgi:hypothetical protein
MARDRRALASHEESLH